MYSYGTDACGTFNCFEIALKDELDNFYFVFWDIGLVACDIKGKKALSLKVDPFISAGTLPINAYLRQVASQKL